MNIRSFHRLLLSFLGVILITCCINTFTINAEVPDVEVLIEGLDEEPTTRKIGEYTSNNSVELWHYSGGYWGYKGLKIYDKDLGDDLKNPDSIANAIKDDIEFEIPIDAKLYNSLIEQEDIKIVCSTTLVDEATSRNREITDLFYDKPVIEIKKNKIYFKGRPRFNFYVEEKYDNIIGDKLNVRIPLVDPEYGYNTYAIWGRNQKIEWGGALGYFDKNDPFAFAPEGSGMIAPAQIKNADGHLIDGFTFKVGNETKLSDDTSIGYYTFKKGGAVGIHFKYPIKFTFYSGEGGEDLEVQFESLPSRAFEGNDVSVVVRVNSTFTTDLKNIPYKWQITSGDGRPLSNINFYGHVNGREGTIDEIKAERGESLLYATFEMPDSDVNIKFEINKDGKNPIENYLENNVIDSGKSIEVIPKPPTVEKNIDLDYNVLSRKIKFPLSDGDFVAKLTLPEGEWMWNGNASGSLTVKNEAVDLLNDFKVENNPVVDESKSTITRRPDIRSILQRRDFGDNPKERVWLNLTNPKEPNIRSGIISFGGGASRKCIDKETNKGPTISEPFMGKNTQVNVRAYVYNGSSTIAPKVFQKGIENNVANSLERKLFWTSKPHMFNVVRLMYHMDENGNLGAPEQVDCQYQRNFTQQNTGKINWSIPASMGANYKRSREAAKRQDTRNSELDRAVFASDKVHQNLAYPIRSGYYFNPTGTYQFTVETVTYKSTNNDTEDHKNIVQALINSFRYESNLVYINNKNQAVDLRNQPANKKGTVYAPKTAVITATNPVGLNGVSWLQVKDRNADSSRYEKKFEEIKHTTDVDGSTTHEFWKNVLEGYTESGTLSSFNNFKYREYVKPGQTMYKITEKTTVTIIVNPLNTKAYTHVQMADGKYNVRAYFADIALNNISGELPTLKGITLDNIEVSVVGSRYDDMGFYEE